MESSFPMFNKLQKVLKTVGDKGFELPQIVVVGSQRVGKSSVLEKIVGRSFLPRGPGIVTRTPLVLQLIHIPQQSGPRGRLLPDEYGVFQHSKTIVTDFEEIRDEIQRRTNTIAGTNKGISDEVVSLKIYSPRVVNLIFVELPGLTYVPVGDQPSDVETLIRNLVLKYIQKPNSIIMAVVSANSATGMNEILKLANDCDPEGRRTLTVVTKLDLMDAGTDATDLLSGRVIPVKLGIIAVINMSQKDINMSQIDINNKKPTITGQIDEAEFLLEKYPSLADCNGTPFLVKTLDKLVVRHVKDYLPRLRKRLQLVINQQEDLVDFYKESVTVRLLQNVVRKISSLYSNKITAFSENFEIRTVFDDNKNNYNYRLDGEQLCATPSLCKSTEISLLLNNAIDKGSFLLLRREDFSVLMKRTINWLRDPSLRCLEFAYDKMKDLHTECLLEMEPMMQRFPLLRDKVRELLEVILTWQRVCRKTVIVFAYAHELNYTNTRPSDFGEEGVMFPKGQSKNELDKIGKFRESFMNSVRMAARDIVEKNVYDHFVNFVKDNVQGELSRFGLTVRLLQEADDIEEIRRQAIKVLEDLNNATHIIEAIEGM